MEVEQLKNAAISPRVFRNIYFNLLMEKDDFTNTTHNLRTQSRVKKKSEFTTFTNDKIWNKTVFRHSLRRCILVRVMFEKKRMIKNKADLDLIGCFCLSLSVCIC